MKLQRLILIPVLVSGVALAGCSGGSKSVKGTGDGGSTAVASGPVSVAIKGFAFAPSSFTIHSGQAITWTNQDDTIHTATVSSGQPGTFDTRNLAQGKAGSFTPTALGTYNYICTIHQYMKGSFTVVK